MKVARKMIINSAGAKAPNAKLYRLGLPIWAVEHLGVTPEDREVEVETVKGGLFIRKLKSD